jgi:methionine--tRNA ligase beta chain
MVTYEDFVKLDLRIGTIVEARVHPNADKLMILKVKISWLEEDIQIVAGIREYYKVEEMENKQIVVLVNLEPREIRGEKSQGILLAASNNTNTLALLMPDKFIVTGSKVG